MTRNRRGSVFSPAVRACADVAGATLVVLMLTTVVDIIARRAGLFSVRGIVEISTMAVVLIGFLALANSFLLGGHIIVDMATTWLPHRVNRRLDAIWLGFAAACFVFLAIMMWRATWKNYQENAVTLDLQLPMAILWLPATIGVSLASIACLTAMVRTWRTPDEQGPASAFD